MGPDILKSVTRNTLEIAGICVFVGFSAILFLDNWGSLETFLGVFWQHWQLHW